MSNKPKQKFSFLFEWNIWKLIFDFQSSYITVEIRDPQSQKIKIVIIDQAKAEIVAEPDLSVKWWSTPSAMNKGKLIVQYFKEARFPEPKGFLCYDVNTNKTIMENSEGAFAFFTGEEIVSTKILFDKIAYESYNTINRSVRELDSNEAKTLVHPEIKIFTPLQYIDSNPHFNTVSRFIKKSTNKQALKGVNYIEANSYIIVSYYIRPLEKLENYLLITNKDGVVLEDILINSEGEEINQETFFIRENHLYFIKDKKELHSYEL